MLGKVEIFFVILALLLLFYIVISLGAGKKKLSSNNKEISRYLFGVRILIIILALVAIILWSIGFAT